MEKELLSTFQDETIIVLADWLKVLNEVNNSLLGHILISFSPCKFITTISGARHFEKLDETLVCSQAGSPPALPFREGSEPPLDRDDHPLVLRVDRETVKEGWLLLQALPPDGPVHLGQQGTRG